MGLLDRFKPTPRWKDADPDVRLGGLREVPDDDQALLGTLARDDPEPRVRRAAAARLTEIRTLGEIVRHETDEPVKAQAVTRLLAIASGRTDRDEPAAQEAVDALVEHRHLATVAKDARAESIAHAALRRLQDTRAIGSVARTSSHASVRLEALGRLCDPAEITSVAVRSEFRDVAVAAVDRLSDPESLNAILARGRTKAAVRRAKALLAAASGSPAPREPDEAERQAEEASEICEALEAALHLEDPADRRSAMERAETRWLALRSLSPVEPDWAERFQAAQDAARARLAEDDARAAEAERLAEAVAEGVAARVRLCEALETVDSAEALERLEIARAEWEGLAPLEDARVELLERRFADAAAECHRRHAQWVARRAAADRQEALMHEAETLEKSGEAEDSRWSAIESEWTALAATSEPAPELRDRVETVRASVRDRATQAREQQDREQRDARRRLQERCRQLEALAASEKLTLKQAERTYREVRSLIDRLGSTPPVRRTEPVPNSSGTHERSVDDPGSPGRGERDAPVIPATAEREELLDRVKRVQTAILPRLQELREADDWQRWANAAIQEQLCVRAEALREVTDLADAARQIRQLQEEWRAVAPGPRSQGEVLWRRFKTALDDTRSRCRTYFADQATLKAANLQRKEGLCQQVEALAESTRWTETAEQIKALQAEWKTIGPAMQEKAVWERFRGACDRFFTRRKLHLDQRKQEWSANLARKEDLCRQVEALDQSTDWEEGLAIIKRLQADWKTVGPVRRNKSEAIWNRFRAACDRFFERYHQRDRLAAATVAAERETLCDELETLLVPAGAPDSDLVPRVLALRERWRQETARSPASRELDERFHGALLRLLASRATDFRGTVLDIEANRRRMEQLCEQVEGFLAASGVTSAGASPVSVLARQLREALAANTIGGRVDDELRWKTAGEDVRRAQAAWRSIGPVPEDVRRQLTARFQRACNQFFEQRRRGHDGPARHR